MTLAVPMWLLWTLGGVAGLAVLALALFGLLMAVLIYKW